MSRTPTRGRLAGAARIVGVGLCLLLGVVARATTYYVDPERGNDQAGGTGKDQPWQTLQRAQRAELRAGDRLLLLAGVRHAGRISFAGLSGTAESPIRIGSYVRAGDAQGARALIDGRNTAAAVGLKNCRYVVVSDLVISADGGQPVGDMRCGVLVEADGADEYRGIALMRLHVKSVSFQNPGYVRPAEDVRTANGTIRYGWGVRFLVRGKDAAVLRDLIVRDCRIERVDHTGLKLTAPAGGIRDVTVQNVEVSKVGGPGIQMSGVIGGRFSNLAVDHSGSPDDTRNWGRGSGLWTWGSKDVVIERSRFTDANGPGDSAGVHIDFGCEDVIVQHCISARNAGGFCEILGDNRNCAYRYNLSVNDGHRVKGQQGAFQEGKIFWLSGYVGQNRTPTGPFNSYFYNNTVYVDESIEPRVAIAPTADGVLVANNIFYFKRSARTVTGDQAKADQANRAPVSRGIWTNNLLLHVDDWPAASGLGGIESVVGDPRFPHAGGISVDDYVPQETGLVRNRGVVIAPLPGDRIGLRGGLAVPRDLRGREVVGLPDLGAIELP